LYNYEFKYSYDERLGVVIYLNVTEAESGTKTKADDVKATTDICNNMI
jgi:hypothetical protein